MLENTYTVVIYFQVVAVHRRIDPTSTRHSEGPTSSKTWRTTSTRASAATSNKPDDPAEMPVQLDTPIQQEN